MKRTNELSIPSLEGQNQCHAPAARSAIYKILFFGLLLLSPRIVQAQLEMDGSGNFGIGLTPMSRIPMTIFQSRGAYNINLRSVTSHTLGTGFEINYKYQFPGSTFGFYANSEWIYSHNQYLGSDSTQKKNITTVSNPITLIQSLRGVRYKWKVDTFAQHRDTAYHVDSLYHFGFIAQQIDSAIPHSTYGTAKILKDSMHYNVHAVAYHEITPILVEALKAQQAEIVTLSEGGSPTCGNRTHFTLGGCAAFTKTDILNTTSRYLEVKTDPSSDARREWIDSSDNKSLKYWDNQGTPVKQTVEIKSDKNAASGYAGLDGSSKLTGSQQTYGTGVNTACQGNDTRLSDSRPLKMTYYDNNTNTLPATAAETIFASLLIPGGSLGNNDVIEITISGDMTNSINNKTYRVWWNNGPTIGGTPFAARAVSNVPSFSGYCKIVMKNSTTSQEVNGPNSNWDATGTSATGSLTATLNINADIYIILTGQKANAGETMSLNNYQIKILKP